MDTIIDVDANGDGEERSADETIRSRRCKRRTFLLVFRQLSEKINPTATEVGKVSELMPPTRSDTEQIGNCLLTALPANRLGLALTNLIDCVYAATL